MAEQSTISKLWDEQKAKIAFASALIPLVSIIAVFIFGTDKQALVALSLALIVYQLGFLIALAFETQKLIQRRTTRRITKIQLNDAFWKQGVHYKTLYLNALNGDRFFEMISNHGIRVDTVRVISPSAAATRTYYDGDIVVTSPTKAAQMMEDSIQSIASNLAEEVTKRHIKHIEVRRLATFPLDFYAVFDGKSCLVGKYLKDPLRKHTIGLKSLSWVEEDPQLISHHTQHFEELWDSLEMRDA